MQKCDYHIHSTYSLDGENNIEEIIKSAIDKGFTEIGISDHSYTFFDESYCMRKEKIPKYIKEINKLKKKYKDGIKVLCGIEQDYYSNEPVDMYDYVIGSVHYLKINDDYLPVDERNPSLKDIADKYFYGDVFEVVKIYYETLSCIVNRTDCDIIGHFDLLSMYNSELHPFDENDDRYRKIWKKAADILILENRIFEINTALIRKNLKDDTMPSTEILNYLKEKGARFILSSDAHNKNDIGYAFERFEEYDGNL